MTSMTLQTDNTQNRSVKSSSTIATGKTQSKALEIPLKKEEIKDKYFNAKTITGSLVGLATIGACVWKFKKTPNAEIINIPPTPSAEHLANEITILTTQVNKIKKLLRDDYNAQRTLIINKMNKFGEFDFKFQFTNINELRQCLEIQRGQHHLLTQKTGEILGENRRIIREKLTELFKNPEWLELKTMRKSLIKTLKSTKFPDEKQIVNHKIKIINDLMINRIYPEEANKYKLIYGIEDNTALEFVRKKHNTYQEHIEEWNTLKNPKNCNVAFPFTEFGKRFAHTDKLSLGDLFKSEVQTIKENEKALSETAEKLSLAESLNREYRQKMLDLAMQYRKKQDVQVLKEQIRVLNSLKASLKNAA